MMKPVQTLVPMALAVSFVLLDAIGGGGVPTGCDPSVMSEAYWRTWNADEQARIDADIEANRKADGVFRLPVPAGTEVEFEQVDHEFRFGAHIFNFNQLGRTEWNDAYKASYGKGGIFNQATVAFYWNKYEPTPGHLRAFGMHEDSERYWNALSVEEAQLDPYWRRPAPSPVIDFLKAKDVAIHGHILIWGSAKPYWIYDWYCPENEKREFDKLGIPRHSTFMKRARPGAELGHGFAAKWRDAWALAYPSVSEEEIARRAPVFTKNMRRVFRKRVFDVAKDFGEAVDSWDVVNESSYDWVLYRKSRTGLGVWKSNYGLMPGDYPLHALLDAKEAFPSAAKLAINDWNIKDDFLEQVKDLEREGARIDIVGCQMHIFNTNDCMRLANGATNVNWVGTPRVIQDRLDMMARTGRPIHVSEITITSPGPDARCRQIQAILTRNIYRKWFAHKSLMGITWWNTVDGGGVWGEPLVSGLFTRDMRKKPAYEALDELINREWRTKGRAKADAGGAVAFRGFRGRYRLSWTCSVCGKVHARTVELTGDGVRETAPQARPDDCLRYARVFSVDGRPVRVGEKETALDLKRVYPEAVVRGSVGERWADVACTLVVPKDGVYGVRYQNDWFGRLFVNGVRVGGDLEGPYSGLRRLELPLKAGENAFRFQTRAGSAGGWTFSLCVPSDSPVVFK